MIRMPWRGSIFSRLAVWLCLAGMGLSAGLGAMDYERSMSLLALATTQQVLQMEQNLQQVLRVSTTGHDPGVIQRMLDTYIQDPLLRAVRLSTSDGRTYAAGKWLAPGEAANIWTLTDGKNDPEDHLAAHQPTVMVASFVENGKLSTLQILIDGPVLHRRMRQQVMGEVGSAWGVLCAAVLLGALLVRRWLVLPLGRITRLIRRKAAATVFEETASEISGEMGDLAGEIGRMVRGLERITEQVRTREQSLQSLFQLAPTAMLSVDAEGRILHVNRRAAEMLGGDAAEMLHRPLCDHIAPEDRGLWRQSLERLKPGAPCGCELRLEACGQRRDAVAEFSAEFDADGRPGVIHLSLVDTTENNRLMQQLAEKRNLLHLLINHMSDAILLVGADGRILTANRQMSEIQRARIDDLVGRRYDPAEFWSRLGFTQPELFQQRIAGAAKDLGQSLQEQFETRDGGLLFQVVPVCDELRQPIAQLWVVQDVSQPLRIRRMLEQQSAQLRALQRVGRRLHTAEGIDALLTLVVSELSEVFKTEAVGVALRAPSLDSRCMQLIWQNADRSNLPGTARVAQAVADQLMRRVLSGKATSFWTDLSQQPDWAAAFQQVGLESMAATPLIGRDQTQGVIWIARRRGNRIEREHLYLLETLAPILAEAFQNAQLRQQMRNLQLSDPVTNLPSARMLSGMIARLVNRPGHPWSMLLVDLDRFHALVSRCGHDAGDQALRLTAQALREACRASDAIVRLEKDRFVLLCPELETHEAAALAQRIRARIAAIDLHAALGIEDAALSCSIGVACSPHDHTRGELTLDIARSRLAQAKASRVAPTPSA